MQKLKILNSREKKELMKIIKNQWDADFGSNFVFLYSERKKKVYVVSRDIELIDLEKLHIDSIGMYFGELLQGLDKESELRLSIEGSQLIGPLAKKNVLMLSDKQADEWIRGGNVFNKQGAEGWVIVCHDPDFMGCGKVKEKVVLNYISKARKILSPLAQEN